MSPADNIALMSVLHTLKLNLRSDQGVSEKKMLHDTEKMVRGCLNIVVVNRFNLSVVGIRLFSKNLL